MKFLTASFAASGLVAASAVAGPMEEPHFDVLLLPDESTGSVRTGAFDDSTESVVSMNERVFPAEFGEADPGQPYFADEPGFRALPGDFAGGEWGFNLLDAARVWDGSDFDAISPYSMTLNFGPSPDVTSPPSADGFEPGFTIPVPANGFDDHLNLFLDVGTDSPTGVYLLTLEVFATGFDPSEPIWFVMNAGAEESVHEAAIEYAENVLVPAPSGVAVAALGIGGLMGRRRR